MVAPSRRTYFVLLLLLDDTASGFILTPYE
jgi:hypothetical protein